MAQDKDEIHQEEGEQAADHSKQTISEAVKKGTDEAKERVVQMKDRAQNLGTRATEAARRVRPAGSLATSVAVGGALTGSLWLLLRRRKRAHTKNEGTRKKAALGLGALALIGRRIRSRRRG